MPEDRVTRTEILQVIADIERRLRCVREVLGDPQGVDFEERARVGLEAFEGPPMDRILWRSCLSEEMD